MASAPGGEGQYYEVLSSHVRVRKEPDLDARSWGSLDRGRKLLLKPYYDGGPWAQLTLFELWRSFKCRDPEGQGFIHCGGASPLLRGPLPEAEQPGPDRAEAAGLCWTGFPSNLPSPCETDLHLNRWCPLAAEEDGRGSAWSVAGAGAARPPPRLCIGAMLRGAPEVCVLSWILYHFRIGFERLYLFFDDPSDPAASIAELFAQHEGMGERDKAVVVHRMTDEWWNYRVFGKYGSQVNTSRFHASHVKSGRGGWGYDVMEAHRQVRDIPARQQICIDLAAQDAQADGLDWILHIDIDELFYLPEAECREDAPRWFARVPEDVESVCFNNHEGIPGFEVDDWFHDVTFFRVNKTFLQPLKEHRGRRRDSTPLDSPHGSGPEDDSDFGDMDGLGVYELLRLSVVTSGVALDSRKVGQLEAGAHVNVLEMVYHREDFRLRARIKMPAGWISILNKKTGYRWAERRAMADAKGEEPAGAAEAVYSAGQAAELKSFSGPFKGTWWPCHIIGPGDEPGTYNTFNNYGVWPNIPPPLLRRPKAGRAKPRARRREAAADHGKYQKALKEMLDEIYKVRAESCPELGTSELSAAGAAHFLGYSDGKAAARLSRAAPAPVPAFVTRFKKIKGDDLKPCVRRRADGDADPAVLHYANCGFSYWISKYKMLGNFPDTVMGFHNTMRAHMASRNLMTNAHKMHWDSKSFRKLELYYRMFVMGNEFGELPCMVCRGLAVPIHGARDVISATWEEAATGAFGQAALAALAMAVGAAGRRIEVGLTVAETWREAMQSRSEAVIWLVVAGEGEAGLAVRRGVEEGAEKLGQGLRPGARLEQLELRGGSLCFRKLDGEGPEAGWVDVAVDGKEMLRLATWQWDGFGFSRSQLTRMPTAQPPAGLCS